MKIYRCVIGSLLVLFIAIGVLYVVSCYGEQRSIEDGTLIWKESFVRGVGEDVTDNCLY